MRKLINQILKFGIVGIVAFIIDYGLLIILSQICNMNPVLAAGISFCVSVIFNYVASMRFVFKHREDMSRQHELAIFIILSVIGLAINEACMWVGLSILGSDAFMITVTKVIATTIVMIWNFASRKKWLDGE